MTDSSSTGLAKAFRLMDAVLDLEPAEREAFLRRAVGDDEKLKQQVLELLSDDALLEEETQLAGRFEKPWVPALMADPEDGSSDPRGPSCLGERIGPYRILDELGRGGMGTVYGAERVDGEVRRRVAIKIIHDRDPRLQKRFLAERQILASLDHPNIARMYDAGTTEDGRSFLVMEEIDGLRIDTFCRRGDLDLGARLTLFRKVLDAVGHAHQRLVIHRDIKPSNILVTAAGEPKLLDFGIAKLLDPSSDETTRTGRVMTPSWASPEQLRGETVTTASDVYSLGLLLYRLLTGRLPHDEGESFFELARPDDDGRAPKRPSEQLDSTSGRADKTWADKTWGDRDLVKIRRAVRGDLDNIVLKALRRPLGERYPTVEAFLQDLRRFEVGAPVSATGDTLAYVVRKFVGRYRIPVAVLVGFLALAAAFVTITHRQSRAVAEAAERTEQTKAFLADLLGAANVEMRKGHRTDVLTLLDSGLDRIQSGEIEDPQSRAELLEVIGNGYRDLDFYVRAAEVYGEAEQWVRKSGLGQSDDLLRLLTAKGAAQYEAGFLPAAAASYRQASALAEGSEREWIETRLVFLESISGGFHQAGPDQYRQLLENFEHPVEDPLRAYRTLVDWAYFLIHTGHGEHARSLLEGQLKLAGPSGRGVDRGLHNLGRWYSYMFENERCVEILELEALMHQEGLTHTHDMGRALTFLELGRCLGRLGRYEEGLRNIDQALTGSREKLGKGARDIRTEYHLALGRVYRAEIYGRLGYEPARRVELAEAREILERLFPEHQIVFIQNLYAKTLIMQGDRDAARSQVEDLLRQGWRRPDLMRMAAAEGLLPDPLPPQVQVEDPLPERVLSYLDELPAVPLPWDDAFDEQQLLQEPQG